MANSHPATQRQPIEEITSLRAELDRTRAELEAVSVVGQAVRATRDLEVLYPVIAAQLKRVMTLDALFISLYFADRSIIRFVYHLDGDIEVVDDEDWPLARASLSRRVIEERTTIRIDDLTVERSNYNMAYFGSQQPTRSWMAAPMLAGDAVQGVINVQSYTAGLYDERHERLLLLIAGQVGVAVENARLVGQLRGTIEELVSDLSLEHERQERMLQELALARRIQNEFLPTELPDLPGAAIFTHVQAAAEVGGDLYLFVPLPDGSTAVAVGDVSGKGIPASLVMAAVCSLLPTLATRYRTPSEVLRVLNGELYSRLRRNRMNVALCYALLDQSGRSITLANAGMPYPAMCQAGTWLELDLGGLPLGSIPDLRYVEMHITLDAGDQLLLHTDGLIETRDNNGEIFGFDRLYETLGKHASATSRQVLHALRVAWRDFNGDEPLDDDMTLLIIETKEA